MAGSGGAGAGGAGNTQQTESFFTQASNGTFGEQSYKGAPASNGPAPVITKGGDEGEGRQGGRGGSSGGSGSVSPKSEFQPAALTLAAGQTAVSGRPGGMNHAALLARPAA